MRRILTSLLTLTLFIALPGCGSEDAPTPGGASADNENYVGDGQTADGQDVTNTSTEDATEKGAIEKELASWGAELDEWKKSFDEKKDQLSEDAREAGQKALDKAQSSYDAAKKKASELKDDSKEGWEKATPHFKEAWAEIKAAGSEIKNAFGDDEEVDEEESTDSEE